MGVSEDACARWHFEMQWASDHAADCSRAPKQGTLNLHSTICAIREECGTLPTRRGMHRDTIARNVPLLQRQGVPRVRSSSDGQRPLLLSLSDDACCSRQYDYTCSRQHDYNLGVGGCQLQ